MYRKENGDIPVAKFINSLDNKMQAKIFREILILEEAGNTLREPYSKYVRDGIFELRIKVSSNITRILYFFYIDKRIILTNGFVKKTDKTPDNEIVKALSYKTDFIERI
jgi:Phage-related protein